MSEYIEENSSLMYNHCTLKISREASKENLFVFELFHPKEKFNPIRAAQVVDDFEMEKIYTDLYNSAYPKADKGSSGSLNVIDFRTSLADHKLFMGTIIPQPIVEQLVRLNEGEDLLIASDIYIPFEFFYLDSYSCTSGCGGWFKINTCPTCGRKIINSSNNGTSLFICHCGTLIPIKDISYCKCTKCGKRVLVESVKILELPMSKSNLALKFNLIKQSNNLKDQQGDNESLNILFLFDSFNEYSEQNCKLECYFKSKIKEIIERVKNEADFSFDINIFFQKEPTVKDIQDLYQKKVFFDIVHFFGGFCVDEINKNNVEIKLNKETIPLIHINEVFQRMPCLFFFSPSRPLLNNQCQPEFFKTMEENILRQGAQAGIFSLFPIESENEVESICFFYKLLLEGEQLVHALRQSRLNNLIETSFSKEPAEKCRNVHRNKFRSFQYMFFFGNLLQKLSGRWIDYSRSEIKSIIGRELPKMLNVVRSKIRYRKKFCLTRKDYFKIVESFIESGPSILLILGKYDTLKSIMLINIVESLINRGYLTFFLQNNCKSFVEFEMELFDNIGFAPQNKLSLTNLLTSYIQMSIFDKKKIIIAIDYDGKSESFENFLFEFQYNLRSIKEYVSLIITFHTQVMWDGWDLREIDVSPQFLETHREETSIYEITEFSSEELRKIYNTAKSEFGLKTTFANCSANVRQIIKNPSFCFDFLKIIRKFDLSNEALLFTPDTFRKLFEAAGLDKNEEEICLKFAKFMGEKNVLELPIPNILNFLKILDNDILKNAINSLIKKGILVLTKKYMFSFLHPEFLYYYLGRVIISECSISEVCEEIIKESSTFSQIYLNSFRYAILFELHSIDSLTCEDLFDLYYKGNDKIKTFVVKCLKSRQLSIDDLLRIRAKVEFKREIEFRRSGIYTLGDEISIKSIFQNTGRNLATNIFFEEELPLGLAFTSEIPIYNKSLPAGSSATLEYRVKLQESGRWNFPVKRISFSDINRPNEELYSNMQNTTIKVEKSAQLILEVKRRILPAIRQFYEGEEVTVELELTNKGILYAIDVFYSDAFEGDSFSISEGDTSFSLSDIAPSEVVAMRYKLKCCSKGKTKIRTASFLSSSEVKADRNFLSPQECIIEGVGSRAPAVRVWRNFSHNPEETTSVEEIIGVQILLTNDSNMVLYEVEIAESLPQNVYLVHGNTECHMGTDIKILPGQTIELIRYEVKITKAGIYELPPIIANWKDKTEKKFHYTLTSQKVRVIGNVRQLPLIGRDNEINVIRSAMDNILAGGNAAPRYIIYGQPGAGKDRFSHEIKAIGIARNFQILSDKIKQFDKPLGAFARMLKKHFRLEENDIASLKNNLQAVLVEELGDDWATLMRLDFLTSYFSKEGFHNISEELDYDELWCIDQLFNLLENISQNRPVVLIVHSIENVRDLKTVNFVQKLLSSKSFKNILFVGICTYLPAYIQEISKETDIVEMKLKNLTSEQAKQFINYMFPMRQLPEDRVVAFIKATNGLPGQMKDLIERLLKEELLNSFSTIAGTSQETLKVSSWIISKEYLSILKFQLRNFTNLQREILSKIHLLRYPVTLDEIYQLLEESDESRNNKVLTKAISDLLDKNFLVIVDSKKGIYNVVDGTISQAISIFLQENRLLRESYHRSIAYALIEGKILRTLESRDILLSYHLQRGNPKLEVDNLENILKSANLAFKTGRNVIARNDYESAFKVIREHPESIKNLAIKIEICLNLSKSCIAIGEIDSAKKYLSIACEQLSKLVRFSNVFYLLFNNQQLLKNIQNLKLLFAKLGSSDRFSLAENYLFRFLLFVSERLNKRLFLDYHLELTDIHWISKQFTLAQRCVQKALKLLNKNPIKRLMILANHLRGNIYKSQRKYLKAREHYDVALSLIPASDISYDYIKGRILYDLGTVYEYDNHKKAINYFDRAIRIQIEISDVSGLARSLKELSKINLMQGDISGAVSNLTRAEEIAQSTIDRTGEIEIFLTWGELYNKKAIAASDLKAREQCLTISQHYLDMAKSLCMKIDESNLLIDIHECLSEVLKIRGHGLNALTFLYQALQLTLKNKDYIREMNLRYSIAEILFKQIGEEEKPLKTEMSELNKQYKEALAQLETIINFDDIDNYKELYQKSLSMTIDLYYLVGSFDMAVTRAQALIILLKYEDNQYQIGKIELKLALVELKRENYEKCEEYHSQAIDRFISTNSSIELAESYESLAQMYEQKSCYYDKHLETNDSDIEIAIDNYEIAIELWSVELNNYKKTDVILKRLIELWEYMQNLEKAFYYLRELLAMKRYRNRKLEEIDILRKIIIINHKIPNIDEVLTACYELFLIFLELEKFQDMEETLNHFSLFSDYGNPVLVEELIEKIIKDTDLKISYKRSKAIIQLYSARALSKINPKKSIKYLIYPEKFFKRSRDRIFLCQVYNTRGVAEFNLYASIYYFNLALKQREDQSGVIYYNLAQVYYGIGDVINSKFHLLRASKLVMRELAQINLELLKINDIHPSEEFKFSRKVENLLWRKRHCENVKEKIEDLRDLLEEWGVFEEELD
jgi:hypothetical protein